MADDAKDTWHLAARSEELTNRPLGRRIQDVSVVLFRDETGQAAALFDRCPHGLGPLSTGYVCGEVLVCAYHGLRVDRRGVCVDERLNEEARAASTTTCYAVEERDGLLWIWMGDPARADRARIPADAGA